MCRRRRCRRRPPRGGPFSVSAAIASLQWLFLLLLLLLLLFLSPCWEAGPSSRLFWRGWWVDGGCVTVISRRGNGKRIGRTKFLLLSSWSISARLDSTPAR